jgi:hypothetical protein
MSDKKQNKFIGTDWYIDWRELSAIFENSLKEYLGDDGFMVEVRDCNQGEYSTDLLINVCHNNALKDT